MTKDEALAWCAERALEADMITDEHGVEFVYVSTKAASWIRFYEGRVEVRVRWGMVITLMTLDDAALALAIADQLAAAMGGP